MSDAQMTDTQLDQLSINCIRTLSIDAVQQAKSGHPGTPMALAPLVYTLWNRVMHFDPQDPIWPNRDRFVLSNGHASMLLWSVLHLSGTRAVNADYETLGQPAVSLDDIKRFRQLGSKAPGHPEYHWTSGVEATTGPLGQGIATSVGMAIAEAWLANRYNREGFEVFGYVSFSEGSEGPSAFAAQADFTSELAEANPDWKLDLNDEVIGSWRGELGNAAEMTLVWGTPMIPGGTLVTGELANLAVDQCELSDQRFTLIAPDNYRSDFLEIKLWGKNGNELARESLYVEDDA